MILAAAWRLTSRGVRVTLLEAGREYNPLEDYPQTANDFELRPFPYDATTDDDGWPRYGFGIAQQIEPENKARAEILAQHEARQRSSSLSRWPRSAANRDTMSKRIYCQEIVARTPIAILERSGATGILHSYTESYETAKRLIDRGFYISFSGIVTFRSADSLRDVARRLPHDRVLIETDTPYLAPVPHRGKENEPGFVVKTAELLASLWAITPEEAGEITTSNFEAAFKVKIPR